MMEFLALIEHSGFSTWLKESESVWPYDVFYLKLTGVVLAVVCIRRIRRQVFGNPMSLATGLVPMNGRILAGALLFIWVGTITAGRLMAYHGIANVEGQASLVVTVAIVLARYAAARLLGGRILGSSKPSQAEV